MSTPPTAPTTAPKLHPAVGAVELHPPHPSLRGWVQFGGTAPNPLTAPKPDKTMITNDDGGHPTNPPNRTSILDAPSTKPRTPPTTTIRH